MAFEVKNLNIDFISDKVSVSLIDQECMRTISLTVPIKSPGNKPEAELREIATKAAKQALQDALDAM